MANLKGCVKMPDLIHLFPLTVVIKKVKGLPFKIGIPQAVEPYQCGGVGGSCGDQHGF